MKKSLIVILALLLLVGCIQTPYSKPKTYPFENKDEPIKSVELFYYPWIVDETEDPTFLWCIRTLETEEIPGFMEAIYSLPTERIAPTPQRDFGKYIARVNYENGDSEYFGSYHIEFVEKGDWAHGVGYYVFEDRDEFEAVFLEYAGEFEYIKDE